MSSMDLPADVPRQVAQPTATRRPAVPTPTMTWVTLALMTTASVASLRAAPTMAVYGSGLRLPLPRPGDRVPAADRPGLRRTRLRLERRRLPLGLRGTVQAARLPRGLVPVRDDDLLLPEPAGVRRLHYRVRHRPGPRRQRRLHRRRHHGPVPDRRLGLLARYENPGGALQLGPDHRHARPRHRPRRPRHGLPRPGQPLGCAHGQRLVVRPAHRRRPGDPGPADSLAVPEVPQASRRTAAAAAAPTGATPPGGPS